MVGALYLAVDHWRGGISENNWGELEGCTTLVSKLLPVRHVMGGVAPLSLLQWRSEVLVFLNLLIDVNVKRNLESVPLPDMSTGRC